MSELTDVVLNHGSNDINVLTGTACSHSNTDQTQPGLIHGLGCDGFDVIILLYEGRSTSSRTVLFSKHTVTAENQNYYEVVLPLLYITYHGLIYNVTL